MGEALLVSWWPYALRLACVLMPILGVKVPHDVEPFRTLLVILLVALLTEGQHGGDGTAEVPEACLKQHALELLSALTGLS